jgi:N-acetylneuraminic acid mutarotase
MRRTLSDDKDGLDVESLSIPIRSFDEWWPQASQAFLRSVPLAVAKQTTLHLPASQINSAAACDSWTGTLKLPPPAVRRQHTAVWTGTEMIVWGGLGLGFQNTGGRYNPSTDDWTYTSTGANVPLARANHTAVWTGTEMIIWGGYAGTVMFNTGGRYNPTSNSWTATSTSAMFQSAGSGTLPYGQDIRCSSGEGMPAQVII